MNSTIRTCILLPSALFSVNCKGDVVDFNCDLDYDIAASAIQLSPEPFEQPMPCEFHIEYETLCSSRVRGVRVEQNNTGTEVPSSFYVTPPETCGTAGEVVDVGPSLPWWGGGGNADVCEVTTDTTDLECNTPAAHGWWHISLPLPTSEVCSDWGDLTARFLVDGEDGCDPPTNTPDDICNAANNAVVDLGHSRSFNDDGGSTYHTQLVPVVSSGPAYSERTWLREVTVTDWGDATKLYILKTGSKIHYTGDAVVEDSGIIVLDSTNYTDTFNVGEVHMGTTFATNAISTSATSWEPPTVTMDWSCEVNGQNPHFVVIGNRPQAYATKIEDLGLFGVNHDQRMKLRIYGGENVASIEMEGRFHDAYRLPITQSGNNWTFDVDDGASGIDAAGSIQPHNTIHKKIVFTRLNLRGHNLGTPTWYLTKFQE